MSQENNMYDSYLWVCAIPQCKKRISGLDIYCHNHNEIIKNFLRCQNIFEREILIYRFKRLHALVVENILKQDY